MGTILSHVMQNRRVRTLFIGMFEYVRWALSGGLILEMVHISKRHFTCFINSFLYHSRYGLAVGFITRRCFESFYDAVLEINSNISLLRYQYFCRFQELHPI